MVSGAGLGRFTDLEMDKRGKQANPIVKSLKLQRRLFSLGSNVTDLVSGHRILILFLIIDISFHMIKTSQQIYSLRPRRNLGKPGIPFGRRLAQELDIDEVVGVVLFVKPDRLSFHL